MRYTVLCVLILSGSTLSAREGYSGYFIRGFAGFGLAQNSLTLASGNVQVGDALASSPLPFQAGLETGWWVLPAKFAPSVELAPSVALEYNSSDLLIKNDDAGFSYLNLNFGLLYALPFPDDWPTFFKDIHIGAHIRYALSGQARFKHSDFQEITGAGVKADGVGFAFRIGKEWRQESDWKVWGVALHYAYDPLMVTEQRAIRELSPSAPPTGLRPGNILPTPRVGRVTELDIQSSFVQHSISIVVSFAYN